MTAKDLWYKPKLIEVALPLEDINDESVREGYIYRGNPSALHKWWAQRPLAACRAVLFAQLVDDPSADAARFPTEEDQKAEREKLHRILSRLVKWENIHDEDLLAEAHSKIVESCGGTPPSVFDPFAGGGSIPVEAQRLGLNVRASDLNPVAVLINKAMTELPATWSGRHPVYPDAMTEQISWPGTSGLATDVRHYGIWVRDEAKERIGHLYPRVTISGVEANIIAWFWARTVTCPNPACASTLPLARSFWLSKKKGRERYAVPILDGSHVRFEIGGPDGIPREGTVGRSGAVCLICNTPIPLAYIRSEGKAGRMGAQLMAMAAEGDRQRYYLAPTEEHELAAQVSRPVDLPDAELPEQALGFRVQGYGMRTWTDLFTNRQLNAMGTLSDLVRETRGRVVADGGEQEYGDAISTYLAFVISKFTDYNCSLVPWYPQEDRPSHVFTRQALSMVWDYVELNPFANVGGTWEGGLEVVVGSMSGLPASNAPGQVTQADAVSLSTTDDFVVCTDPPYYDNVGYADLADFFYVWLRRSLREIYPNLMSTVLTPKREELVADPFRHNGKANAEIFFEGGFESVFRAICASTPEGFPITVFYAFKQSEKDDANQHASTGWETLLEGMLRSGWAVTATWPMRTERKGRTRDLKSNALASSIVLACRPRPADASFTDRRGLISALREELPDALRKLEQGKVAPVDLRQAAIGPGMAVFSRYARVNEPDGSSMRVRAALSLINQVLDEKLSQLEGNVLADTRWCVEWFKQYGFDQGPYGTAETLSKGIDTSITGLERAGVLVSRAGKVKLQSVRDIPDFYDPRDDERTSEWEIFLHLAKQLDRSGVDAAASLMAAAREVPGIDLDDVRELAYLLYSIAETKGWAETALLFNNLGTSWTDIEDASRRATPGAGGQSGQGELVLEYGSDEDGDE